MNEFNAQAAIDQHISENTSAKQVSLHLTGAIALAVITALAPFLIDFLPQIPLLLQSILPAGIYNLLAPLLLLAINAAIAWLATLAKKENKKAVTQALATTPPAALERYYSK